MWSSKKGERLFFLEVFLPKLLSWGLEWKIPYFMATQGAENDYLTEQLFQHQQCLRTSICPRNPVCWHFHLLHSLLRQGFKIFNVWIMSNSNDNISLIIRQLLPIADVEAMHHMAFCCFWRCDKTMATFPVIDSFLKIISGYLVLNIWGKAKPLFPKGQRLGQSQPKTCWRQQWYDYNISTLPRSKKLEG